MNKINNLNKIIERKINKSYKKNFLKIPFETFVLRPNSHKNKIEKFLNVKFDMNVYKTMKKEKVPRLKIIDGRNTKIYQKYLIKNKHFNEYDEIITR